MLQLMLQRLADVRVAQLSRAAAAAYVGSFLARAAFVPPPLVVSTVQVCRATFRHPNSNVTELQGHVDRNLWTKALPMPGKFCSVKQWSLPDGHERVRWLPKGTVLTEDPVAYLAEFSAVVPAVLPDTGRTQLQQRRQSDSAAAISAGYIPGRRQLHPGRQPSAASGKRRRAVAMLCRRQIRRCTSWCCLVLFRYRFPSKSLQVLTKSTISDYNEINTGCILNPQVFYSAFQALLYVLCYQLEGLMAEERDAKSQAGSQVAKIRLLFQTTFPQLLDNRCDLAEST